MSFPENRDDLKRIVQERLEETIRLEFKRELPSSGKNDDVARDVAAMANTEGGVIVYGIEQDDAGRARALHPISISGVAERATLVAQTLDESLTLLAVRTIPADASHDQGFLVVEVPTSERAPHFFKGTAWGRTSKGNVTLTRRQVGELFARSPGFAQEFGLAMGRPGRVFAQLTREPYQETDSGGRLRTRQHYYLVLRNDGETAVFHANWDWVTDESDPRTLPTVLQNPFPLEVLQAGAQVQLGVHASIGAPSDLRVRTHWRDAIGQDYDQLWATTW